MKKKNERMLLRLLKFNVLNWSDEDFEKSICLLQEREKNTAKKFYNKIDGKRSTSCHLILKSQLSDMHGLSICNIKLERTRENKPIWKCYDYHKYPCLNFNVSHSGNFGIVGICSHSIIGVDVQDLNLPGKIRNIQEMLDSLSNCYSWREYCVITLQEDYKHVTEEEIKEFLDKHATDYELERIKRRFYCFWCLKESYLKAIGTGIYQELDQMEFIFGHVGANDDLLKMEPSCVVEGKPLRNWKFKLVPIDKNHVAAVAFGPLDCKEMTKTFRESLMYNESRFSISDLHEKRDLLLENCGSLFFEEVLNPVSTNCTEYWKE